MRKVRVPTTKRIELKCVECGNRQLFPDDKMDFIFAHCYKCGDIAGFEKEKENVESTDRNNA